MSTHISSFLQTHDNEVTFPFADGVVRSVGQHLVGGKMAVAATCVSLQYFVHGELVRAVVRAIEC
jgi:hypothetical protein